MNADNFFIFSEVMGFYQDAQIDLVMWANSGNAWKGDHCVQNTAHAAEMTVSSIKVLLIALLSYRTTISNDFC